MPRTGLPFRLPSPFPCHAAACDALKRGDSYKGRLGESQSSQVQLDQEDQREENKETQRSVGAKVASHERDQFAFEAGKQNCIFCPSAPTALPSSSLCLAKSAH